MNRLGKSLPPLASLLPFEAAARLESFTRAAAELHLTQAAVSRQIRALEDDLGTRLFERRNRAVFLTEAGRELGGAVSGALETVAARADDLRGRHREGEVVMFAQLCEAFYWVMPRLAGFHQRHPRVELRVAASTRPLTEAAERFDVALQTTGRAQRADWLRHRHDAPAGRESQPSLVAPSGLTMPSIARRGRARVSYCRPSQVSSARCSPQPAKPGRLTSTVSPPRWAAGRNTIVSRWKPGVGAPPDLNSMSRDPSRRPARSTEVATLARIPPASS